jgi:hypothetical protein
MYRDLYEGIDKKELDLYKPSKELGFNTTHDTNKLDLLFRANSETNCKNIKYILG